MQRVPSSPHHRPGLVVSKVGCQARPRSIGLLPTPRCVFPSQSPDLGVEIVRHGLRFPHWLALGTCRLVFL
ncbi:hypothetical protein CGRA01v4_12970 [Colletotrichum graminicola]|nr:hypothetical protein CGRA01v4_12970 [Colletotrichum graminicola]